MNSTVSLKSRMLVLMLLAVTAISCNQSKSDINNSKNMEIKWTKLSTDGLQDNLAKGVSATFAALIEGKLIVGGGANFPDKLGLKVGQKHFMMIFYYMMMQLRMEIDWSSAFTFCLWSFSAPIRWSSLDWWK